MYFGSSSSQGRGLAAYSPAAPAKQAKPKGYGLMGLPTFSDFGDAFAAPAPPARITPIQMAQPPAPTYKPVAPPPTLSVPSGHLGQQQRINTAPGTGGSQGLANQGYGLAPGAGNYGGAPTQPAAAPAATPPNFGLSAPMAPAVDPRMERMLAAYEAQIAKNTRLRDDGLARLAGLDNPYMDAGGQQARGLAGARSALDAQGARDGIHGQNDAINRMMAGGGLLAQQDLNALNDNVRAGVMTQQSGLAADYANRSTEWDRWREGLRGQFEQADLAGSQISNLVTQSRQGATLSSELDQMRAQTQNMVAQGRINAAQAQQAEDIAKNQGWYAALEFLIKAAPGALALGAALL